MQQSQSQYQSFPPGVFGAGLGAPASGGFTPSCSQSSTFLAAATGITLTADKTNYDTMICGLVSDSEWNFDVLYIWAAPSATNAALINLANPGTYNGTTSGTVSFSAYNGYTGNGSTFYIDTGFNTSTAPSPNYTQNNANFGVYDLTNRSSGGGQYNAGNFGNSNTFLNDYQFSQAQAGINNGSSGIAVSVSSTQGLWNVTRPTLVSSSLFLNDSETAVQTVVDTTGSLNNNNFYFFAANGPPAELFTSSQLAAGWIGKGLAAADSCKISRRINTYMKNLATPINVFTNGGSAC